MSLASLLFFAAILGLLVGSFLCVVIYRLPLMLKSSWEDECKNYLSKQVRQNFIKSKVFNLFCPRSHCPHCNNIIPFFYNVPLLGFVLLHGKCKACGLNISWRYPFVEVISALVAVVAIYKFGLHVQSLVFLLLSWGLIVLIFIDIDHQILPDSIIFSCMWLGLLVNAFNTFTSASNAILGALVAYCFLYIVAYIFKLIRNIDGMGNGDFKLFAVFGAWLGWAHLPFIIIVAALLGSIVGIITILLQKKTFQTPIPFGPYLAIAGWSSFFYGNDVLNWYLG